MKKNELTLKERIAKEQQELHDLGIETSFYFPKGVNYLRMPANPMKPTDENMEKWNKVIDWLKSRYSDNRLIFTKSGGISAGNFRFGYVTRDRKSYFEIVAVTAGGAFRVTFTSTFDIVKEGGMTGREAFHLIKKEFKKDGIDLMDYATKDGLAIKTLDIKKPLINLVSAKPEVTYEHVHHLDLHSAYPSGLIANHPEFMKTIMRIYERRKQGENNKKLKLALDASIGFMQSEYCTHNGSKYALASLSRDGVNWCCDKIISLGRELIKQGYTPLACNTDGIWYAKFNAGKCVASEPLHCESEGETLGTYANDHIDCKVRWKSKGCYEFIENGVYKPVVRGSTRLDKIKSRDNWNWGDIFQEEANIISYALENNHCLKRGE